MDIKTVEGLAKWSAPKEVQTKYGPRIFRRAAVTPEFSAAWKTQKDAVKAVGAGFAKDRDGNWELTWWMELPKEVQEARVESIAASRATNAEIDLPRPAGLEYMPFQKAGIRYGIARPNVLIADEMGLGKTIEAIGIINADPTVKTVLVVCPKSLKLNWSRELYKWLTRPMTIGVVNGGWPSTDIVVINYDILSKWSDQIAARGTWDMLVVDECFPYNTRVRTDQGLLKIGDIVEQGLAVRVASFDLSCNVLQYKCITGYVKKPINLNHRLVSIKHELGEIVCTENHMIWTEVGYVEAGNIKSGARVLVLPQEIYDHAQGQDNSKVLLQESCFLLDERSSTGEGGDQYRNNHDHKNLCVVRKGIQFQDDGSWQRKAQVLREPMRGEMENEPTGTQRNSEHMGKRACGWEPIGNDPARRGSTNASNEPRSDYQGAYRSGRGKVERRTQNVFETGWKRTTNRSTVEISGGFGMGYGSAHINGTREGSIRKLTPVLQSGFGEQNIESGCGSGWENAPVEAVEVSRPAQRSGIVSVGVVSVEVLERSRYAEFGCGGTGNQYVYCLEIEDNHNFFAEGVLVSNCHLIKNKKTIRSQNVKSIKARRNIRMTGTPIVNRPIELFNIITDLAPDQFGSFWSFAKRYANARNDGWGWQFDGASNLDELQKRLRETIMVRRLKSEVLTELPRKVRQVIEMEPDTAAQKQAVRREQGYEKQSEERLARLRADVELAKGIDEDAYVMAVERLQDSTQVDFTEMSRLRHETALSKVDTVIAHIMACLEDNDNKIVIAAHHRDVVDAIKAGLMEYNPVVLMGGMSERDRQASVDTFQNDPKCRVFVGGIMAAGVGITLTAASHVVFAELDWVPGNITQFEDRCHRIGQTQTVLVQHIVLNDSLDARMAKMLVEKQAVIDNALDVNHPDRVAPVYQPKASAASSGMPMSELEKIGNALTPAQVDEIHGKLRILAGMDGDFAGELNDVGFNKIDTMIGHSLAERASLSPKQAAIGLKLVTKYKRQVGQVSWLEGK